MISYLFRAGGGGGASYSYFYQCHLYLLKFHNENEIIWSQKGV